MAETLDLTLDDIIKNNKKSNPSSGGGGGRHREGRRGSAAGGSAGGALPAAEGTNESNGVGFSSSAKDGLPFSPRREDDLVVFSLWCDAIQAPESAWQHDMYSGGGSGGGRFSAIETSTKLFITNLDFGVSTEDVKELFSELGDLKRCFIHSDQNGRSKGTAEVIYARRGDAVAPVPTAAALGSPARAPDPSSPQEMASLPIPNELVVEIFLRLPTPADLARASAACVSFRRLATDHSFLRRFRKLHAPPLLGFIDDRDIFLPALPLHPSAPAVAAAADFTFSFLPAPADWDVQDVRDGRVLLDHDRFGKGWHFEDLAVCDPLHQRYIMLPPIPQAASVKDPRFHESGQSRSYSGQIFLLPSPPGEEQEDEETSFRVFWMAFSKSKTKLVAFVFSSSTGQWLAVAADLLAGCSFSGPQRAYGCVYWPMDGRTKLVVFDTRGMEFSIADFPPGWGGRERIAIVEAGEGRLGLFGRSDDRPYDLCYTIQPNNVEGFNQWQVEKTIKLDYGYYYTFIGSMEGYLLLCRTRRPSNEGPSKSECLSLDVKTLQLERVCASESGMMMEMYTNFPPSLLSSPTV